MIKRAFVVVGAMAMILCGAVQTGMMHSSCDAANSQLVSNHSGGWWSN